MRYIEILISAALLSFLLGLFYATQSSTNTLMQRAVEAKPISHSNTRMNITDEPNKAYDIIFKDTKEPNIVSDDSELPSCSKVNTMPCTAIENNPVKDELREKAPINNIKPFVKGEKVTCIYPAIRSTAWSDGTVEEFVETMPMKCKVVTASEVWNEIEPNYQHIQVNCKADLESKWTNQPGVGLVKGHALNYVERWFSSTDCYHFQ